MPIHKGGKKGAHKYGRNEEKCKRYFAQSRFEKNAKKRLRRHLSGQPKDKVAQAALDRLGR